MNIQYPTRLHNQIVSFFDFFQFLYILLGVIRIITMIHLHPSLREIMAESHRLSLLLSACINNISKSNLVHLNEACYTNK